MSEPRVLTWETAPGHRITLFVARRPRRWHVVFNNLLARAQRGREYAIVTMADVQEWRGTGAQIRAGWR